MTPVGSDSHATERCPTRVFPNSQGHPADQVRCMTAQWARIRYLDLRHSGSGLPLHGPAEIGNRACVPAWIRPVTLPPRVSERSTPPAEYAAGPDRGPRYTHAASGWAGGPRSGCHPDPPGLHKTVPVGMYAESGCIRRIDHCRVYRPVRSDEMTRTFGRSSPRHYNHRGVAGYSERFRMPVERRDHAMVNGPHCRTAARIRRTEAIRARGRCGADSELCDCWRQPVQRVAGG